MESVEYISVVVVVVFLFLFFSLSLSLSSFDRFYFDRSYMLVPCMLIIVHILCTPCMLICDLPKWLSLLLVVVVGCCSCCCFLIRCWPWPCSRYAHISLQCPHSIIRHSVTLWKTAVMKYYDVGRRMTACNDAWPIFNDAAQGPLTWTRVLNEIFNRQVHEEGQFSKFQF